MTVIFRNSLLHCMTVSPFKQFPIAENNMGNTLPLLPKPFYMATSNLTNKQM